jgi:hypothetical protein
MGIADDFLVMDAVYWPPAGKDDLNQPRYGPPVQIRCRWNDTNQTYSDNTGQTRVSMSFVLTDRRLQDDGMIRKGGFDLLVDPTIPLKNPGTYRIVKTGNTPSAEGSEEEGVNFAWL